MGLEIEYRREDFDLDEDEPLRADRNERDFDGLVARSLNDHWSVGGRGQHRLLDVRQHRHPVVRRSGDRIQPLPVLAVHAQAAALRLRRRSVLRAVHAKRRCSSQCPTRMAQQQASVTIDQREPWGSLQAELEYSTFLPDAVALPHPARRGRQRAACARPFTVHRRQHEPDPRSDLDSSPGCDAGGSAAAPPPAAERLRVQPSDRPHVYLRVHLQHDCESAVRTVGGRWPWSWAMVDGRSVSRSIVAICGHISRWSL